MAPQMYCQSYGNIVYKELGQYLINYKFIIKDILMSEFAFIPKVYTHVITTQMYTVLFNYNIRFTLMHSNYIARGRNTTN